MEDKNSASEDTVKMEADDGKPNHVEDKENAMDGTTTNVIFFSSILQQNLCMWWCITYKENTFLKQL